MSKFPCVTTEDDENWYHTIRTRCGACNGPLTRTIPKNADTPLQDWSKCKSCKKYICNNCYPCKKCQSKSPQDELNELKQQLPLVREMVNGMGERGQQEIDNHISKIHAVESKLGLPLTKYGAEPVTDDGMSGAFLGSSYQLAYGMHNMNKRNY